MKTRKPAKTEGFRSWVSNREGNEDYTPPGVDTIIKGHSGRSEYAFRKRFDKPKPSKEDE